MGSQVPLPGLAPALRELGFKLEGRGGQENPPWCQPGGDLSITTASSTATGLREGEAPSCTRSEAGE